MGVVDWTDRLHDCGEMSNRVTGLGCSVVNVKLIRITTKIQ